MGSRLSGSCFGVPDHSESGATLLLQLLLVSPFGPRIDRPMTQSCHDLTASVRLEVAAENSVHVRDDHFSELGAEATQVRATFECRCFSRQSAGNFHRLNLWLRVEADKAVACRAGDHEPPIAVRSIFVGTESKYFSKAYDRNWNLTPKDEAVKVLRRGDRVDLLMSRDDFRDRGQRQAENVLDVST